MFASKGTLRYSPKLLGTTEEKWWLILFCSAELGGYYRRLYELNHYRSRKLQAPGWKDHVSVVRNEEPPNRDIWFKYEGLEVEFRYEPIVKNNNIYFWLEVECEFLSDLRIELGLPRKPEFDFHVTVGNNINL